MLCWPYSALMRLIGAAFFISVMLSAMASTPSPEPNWAGEYADKKFLNGQAVVQMSITQSGNAIQIAFDASNGKIVSRILEPAGSRAQAKTS